jgi:RimJ/RimL family protein N-acetyltransferase
MEFFIETERLRLRKLNLDDAPFMVTLLNTPSWLKFIGDRGVRNTEEAEKYLQNGTMKSYETHGFGFYLMELKSDKTPIGICGLVKRDFLEHADIGFALLPEFEGKGYGYEAASATLAFAKKSLGIKNIAAITVIENTNSVHLLEKLGLAFQKKVVYPETQEELLLYYASLEDLR